MFYTRIPKATVITFSGKLKRVPCWEKLIFSSTGGVRSRAGALCGRISILSSRSRLARGCFGPPRPNQPVRSLHHVVPFEGPNWRYGARERSVGTAKGYVLTMLIQLTMRLLCELTLLPPAPTLFSSFRSGIYSTYQHSTIARCLLRIYECR